MSDLETIRPKSKGRVYDLVREAGLDVSDWGNFSGGERDAARNPRYCYEWAFSDGEQCVVLNLWFEKMQMQEDRVFQELNMREVASNQAGSRPSVAVGRAKRMDAIINDAYLKRLPIRTIVCSRVEREPKGNKHSRVAGRILDPLPWVVESYDDSSGRCVIARGSGPIKYVDQFDVQSQATTSREVQATVFVRDAAVRRAVLERAGGFCEWCGELGFIMPSGKVFLETHHIDPLSQGGKDDVDNVIALCPNHHREAHYGAKAREMQIKMQSKVSTANAEQGNSAGRLRRR